MKDGTREKHETQRHVEEAELAVQFFAIGGNKSSEVVRYSDFTKEAGRGRTVYSVSHLFADWVGCSTVCARHCWQG